MASPKQAEALAQPLWWATAGALLALGLAAVLLSTLVTQSTGRWTDAPAPIIAAGADLIPTRGAGHKDGKAFVLEAAGAEGVAVLTASLSPFEAREFPRVEWTLDAAQPPSDLAFAWRTREHPKRNYSKRLRWLVNGVAPLELKAEDGWSGTITGVALLTGSGVPTPLTVGSLRIVSRSASAAAGELVQQWSARNVLHGYSVNFPFDSERAHDLPALIAIAVAEGLAICAYLLLARWRRWPRDRRVLWGIFLGGWLLLDLRWQANLWREAGARGLQFAGKTTEEKHLAAEDAALFVIMEKMKSGLPSAPVRVFLYCDNDLLCARAAFLVYPQNVYRAVQKRRPPPTPDELRGGDYLLLVYSRALGYDPTRGLAVWADGGTKPAEEILLQPEALLLRIR